jgi:putative spermidine/putrescine transport system ATP-binding protein
VTHDQAEAMTLSDRVAVYRNGRIEQVAPPLEVYRRPATRFVGEFIGDSNFFTARRGGGPPGAVLIDGLGPARIEVEAWAKLPGDQPFSLLIRPEQFRVLGSDTAQGMNTIETVVRDVIHTGDSALVIADARGTVLRIRLMGSAAEALAMGAPLRLAWAPKDAHVVME